MKKILCSTGALIGKPNGRDYKLLEPLGKQLDCDGFEINCDLAKAIGAEKLVLHLWSGHVSDSNFQSNLAAYQRLREIADSYGFVLGIENVVCNVENPMKHMCELREAYPDIRFVFDTKMAAFHEQLDLLYEREYEWLWKDGHICHYHVNDYNGGYMDWANLRTLRIGMGKLDFERFFAFVRETGYEGDYTLEASAYDSEGNVDVDKQFAYVREKIS